MHLNSLLYITLKNKQHFYGVIIFEGQLQSYSCSDLNETEQSLWLLKYDNVNFIFQYVFVCACNVFTIKGPKTN